MPVLNDAHSRLNATEVARVVAPATPEAVAVAVADATAQRLAVCPAGALHSMGGQQFASGGVSISSSALTAIGPLDRDSATVWVQSGVTWPRLVEWLHRRQAGADKPLTIIQKQTGADELTLGGALSSNAHGRVLGRKPIVADVEAFHLTLPNGDRVLCSRELNSELFRAAIGGYGLFGFIDSIKLKLEPRSLLARRVREIPTHRAIHELEEQMARGASYGDFQFMTDETSADFMRRGILSTYAPAGSNAEAKDAGGGLSTEDWTRLYALAHTDKSRAYAEYASHYLGTDGQPHWSDDHQFSPYLPDASAILASRLGWTHFRSLMISELYVPRHRFDDFMESARSSLLDTEANLVYGTVRLIEADDETALRWAKQDYACIIFNLLVEHTPDGIDRARTQFQSLIDRALELDGCYYLTYHRWARRDQLERAYPELGRFLELKDRYDPRGVFSSDWYRSLVSP